MKNNNKVVLAVILILLIPSLIMGSAGYAFKLVRDKDLTDETEKIPENPDKEFAFSGYLYFYSDDELLGTYKCEHPENSCDWAYEYVDDSLYFIDFYDDNEIDKFSIINNRYVLLVDNDGTEDSSETILYDLKEKRIISRYKRVKNYTIGTVNNRIIVQNEEDMWGVVELSETTPRLLINFEYDFIGLINDKVADKLKDDRFVVKEQSQWYIIGDDKRLLSTKMIDPIFTYNNEHIIAKIDNLSYLYNYEGIILLNGRSFKDMSFAGRYIAVLDHSNLFYIIDMKLGIDLTPKKPVPLGSTYEAKMTSTGIELRIGNNTDRYPIFD